MAWGDEMKIKFGAVTSSEIEVMLDATSEPIAKSILVKYHANGGNGHEFDLTVSEAVYLRDNLWGDCERVAEACGNAAGRAFEAAGTKLDELIKAEKEQVGPL
jgi:hypothetical protein